MAINCNWCALLMLEAYSDASMGKVPPLAPPALFRLPSASTRTQPAAPGVEVKANPAKLDALAISPCCSPMPPLLPSWLVPWISQ